MNTTKNMQILPIDDLIPYINNARTHSKDQIQKLRASLREFGFVTPILIDMDKNVIAGHGRLMAAREEGITEVPCVIVDFLTEAQKKAYILADNRMALDAGWDADLLKLELAGLQDLGFDLSLTGFSEPELDDLFDDGQGLVQDDDFDLTSALEKASFVEPGDLWIVGRHKLLCGDATNPRDVATLMGDDRANLILTDPPYGVTYKSSDGLTIQNDSLKGDGFYQFLFHSFVNMVTYLEPGGAAYVFHADTEGFNFRKAFCDAGLHLAGCCIWVKNSLVLGRSDYQWQHEPVLYGFLPEEVEGDYTQDHEPILYGFLRNGKHAWYSDRKQTTIWQFDKPKRSRNHPTSKPLDLLSYPIANSTRENALVMDLFGGSGSTLMACELMKRSCYMMELDPKYASVILRRYIENGGNPALVYTTRNGERVNYRDVAKEVSR